MRPREPVDPQEESFTGYQDYPQKPKIWTPQVEETQMDQFAPYVDKAPTYGTITQKAPVDSSRSLQEQPVKFRRLDRVRVAEKSLFLVWWPAFLGVCIVAAFGLGYWRYHTLAYTVLALILLVGFAMITIGLNGGMTNKASMTFMTVNGCTIIFVAAISTLLGLYCFQTYTKSYEIYRGSRFYENIAPSENPGAYRDAGVIQFAAGSTVDVAHSIGLRNGDTYCVAPIISPDSSRTGFWAAGMNCCGNLVNSKSARGSFRCGGDAALGAAGAGLVVLDESYFSTPEIPEYTKAAEEASAQFGIGMQGSSKPMFVMLSGNVNADKDQFFHDATSFVVSSAAGLFVFTLVIAMVFSTLSGSAGFANNYYSVEVLDWSEFEAPRKSKASRRKQANAAADPFRGDAYMIP